MPSPPRERRNLRVARCQIPPPHFAALRSRRHDEVESFLPAEWRVSAINMVSIAQGMRASIEMGLVHPPGTLSAPLPCGSSFRVTAGDFRQLMVSSSRCARTLLDKSSGFVYHS